VVQPASLAAGIRNYEQDKRKLLGGGELWTRLSGHVVMTGPNMVFPHSFGFLKRLLRVKKKLHVLLVCNTFPVLTRRQDLQYKALQLRRAGQTASHRGGASSHPRSLFPQSIFITALALPEEFQY